MPELTVIGGGLAGCEAAWQAANAGCAVRLYEMRPVRSTPAHATGDLAELVCSNSFKSESPERAGGLLKEELAAGSSLIMAAAQKTRTPAGEALAVDRRAFAREITERIQNHPRIELCRAEAETIPPEGRVIIASGPLTSPAFAAALAKLCGAEYLYFYDAIAPIVDAATVDRNKVWAASRHERGEGAYLNCPLNEEEYYRLAAELERGQVTPTREFEKEIYYAGCLPVEEMARRGRDTLAFGPLKPVGLIDPATGTQPFAVVQLRPEDREGKMYNLVGFQTRLTYPEQERIFRMIPGLERVEFLRLGSCHRNTFINAARLLGPGLTLKTELRIQIAGQLSGVEGYVESTAMGWWTGTFAAAALAGKTLTPPPPTTALGALLNYLASAEPEHFQPMAVNFGLFPPPEKRIKRSLRRGFYAERSRRDFRAWLDAAPLKTL